MIDTGEVVECVVLVVRFVIKATWVFPHACEVPERVGAGLTIFPGFVGDCDAVARIRRGNDGAVRLRDLRDSAQTIVPGCGSAICGRRTAAVRVRYRALASQGIIGCVREDRALLVGGELGLLESIEVVENAGGYFVQGTSNRGSRGH